MKIVQVPQSVLDGDKASAESSDEVATHGDRPGRPVIEKCPNCGFAYADGAYCESCGWFQPQPDCPHCQKAKK